MKIYKNFINSGVDITCSSDVDLDSLVPKAKQKLLEWYKACIAAKLRIIITQGFRSIEYQNGVYAQGRTKPGKIVTVCKGGQSPHNYGFAWDFAPLEPNGTINWSTFLNPKWKQAATIAKNLKLDAGAFWKIPGFGSDTAHIELMGGSNCANMIYKSQMKLQDAINKLSI